MQSTRVCYRVDHGGPHDLEFDLDADTTIGEVACFALGHLPPPHRDPQSQGQGEPTLAHRGVVLDPTEKALVAGPPSGSSVTLAVAGPSRKGDGRHREPVCSANHSANRSPVLLHVAGGDRHSIELDYGYNAPLPGLVVEVSTEIRVRPSSSRRVSVDGEVCRSLTVVSDRSLIRCGENVASLEQRAMLSPPAIGPLRTRTPTPAAVTQSAPVEVDLPQPPGRSRLPGFPVLSATVPLLMGAALWAFTRSLWSVGFMAFTFVYVLASGVESRREARREQVFAEESFREQLARARETLERVHIETELSDDRAHPSSAELQLWFNPISERVWERGPSHPSPLEVRLGEYLGESRARIPVPTSGRADLIEEVAEVVETHRMQQRPLVLDLGLSPQVAIIGQTVAAQKLLRSILFQLAVLCPPEVVGISTAPWESAIRFHDWLPAAAEPRWRIRVGGQGTAGQGGAGKTDTEQGGSNLIELFLASHPDLLTNPPPTTIRLRADGSAWLHSEHNEPIRFTPEECAEPDAEAAARQMAPFASAAARRRGGSALRLADIGVDTDPAAILARWSLSRIWGNPGEPTTPEVGQLALSAPIGCTADGSMIAVDLVADGPHALVAGTTGSGKSELLRTWIASLASRYSPLDLNFLLLDYKGGAAFSACSELPHCVGLVTDLRSDLAARALASLRAELRRRELCLEQHGVSDLHAVPPSERPARIVVVIDEFATLAKEMPDFLDGVLDIAQRGRSLGFHLILATQRPAGVISDSIRANTELRIALRLPDADDSIDVVGDPAASQLPRGAPGRAVIRFGHEDLLECQIAHSGAPAAQQKSIRVRDLGAGTEGAEASPDHQETRSGLERLVEMARELQASSGCADPRRPWVEPLPTEVPLEDLPASAVPTLAHIGLSDRVESQSIGAAGVDLDSGGGVVICGAARSGRSTALGALAAAACSAGHEVHLIDCRSTPHHLVPAQALATAMAGTDHEAVHRLLQQLATAPPATHTLLLVDGMAEFGEQQEHVNRGRALELLCAIASRSATSGVAVAVTASRRSDVPHQLLHLLGNRVLLRVHDRDETIAWDAPQELADRNLPAGRGFDGTHWIQIAQAPPGSGDRPEPPRLPTMLQMAHVGAPPSVGKDSWQVTVGIGSDDLLGARWDLSHANGAVIGPRGSGRSTALATVAAMAAQQGIGVIEVSGDGTAEVANSLASVRSALEAANQAATDRLLVIFDDLDHWAEDTSIDEVVCDLARSARRGNHRVVASMERSGAQRTYAESVLMLRHARNALLLGPDSHDLGSLVETDIVPRDDIVFGAGRGFLVNGGATRVVQVGISTPGSQDVRAQDIRA